MEQHSFGNASECSICGEKFTVLYGPLRVCEECLNVQSEVISDEAPADEVPADEGEESPDGLEMDPVQMEEMDAATLSWAESLAEDIGAED